MSIPRRTTTLEDLWRFLRQQGAWGPGGMDALHAHLSRRRQDEPFWEGLRERLSRLEDPRVRTGLLKSSAPEGVDLDRMIDALRQALPHTGGDARGWARRSASLPALFAFLVLGLASACKDDKDDTGEDGGDGAEALCAEAEAEDMGQEAGEVYCELIELVEEADIDATLRQDVLDCLPGLSEARRQELLDAFASASEEELVTLIENLRYSEECGWEDAH